MPTLLPAGSKVSGKIKNENDSKEEMGPLITGVWLIS